MSWTSFSLTSCSRHVVNAFSHTPDTAYSLPTTRVVTVLWAWSRLLRDYCSIHLFPVRVFYYFIKQSEVTSRILRFVCLYYTKRLKTVAHWIQNNIMPTLYKGGIKYVVICKYFTSLIFRKGGRIIKNSDSSSAHFSITQAKQVILSKC